ncbi:hypothetical protein [Geminocystis sp. NIES-3709]|uniref:hypothetical protein n=1 Tax=Geminocystis sp. NIES-3709 TaxID=1617448 RepID=UPI0005FC5C9E|nr:hypothetical protein [Geminocystis sp. NIES-3709]BAQ66532.1 hypothetical protein GM3709_3297 [Geminocystis sp. NIES-3709]
MNNFRKTLLTLGVIGLGSVVAPSAFAQSYASGSSTIVLMNGASQSVGAEISIPSGLTFLGTAGNGEVTVTPTLGVPGDGTADTGLAINEQEITTLVVDPGLPDASILSATPTTFTAAAAAALVAATTAADLQAQVSIIRAGAGVDGLE